MKRNNFKDDANGEMLSVYSGDLALLFKILPDTIKFTVDENHKHIKFEFDCVDSKFKIGDHELTFKQFDESVKCIKKNSKRWLTKRKDRITKEDLKREEERDADFDKLYEMQHPSEKEVIDSDNKNILHITQEQLNKYN